MSPKILLVSSLTFISVHTSALAFDPASVGELLKMPAPALKLTPILVPTPAAAPTLAPAPAATRAPAATSNQLSTAERLAWIERLTKAFDSLSETCEGRFGILQSRLRMQTVRAETISIAGGVIGVIGTIATCPHCAALASGLAGLANPLQQTFRDNSDAPVNTIAALKELSDSIKNDFSIYQGLPMPQIVSDSDDAFMSRWLTRRDKLMEISYSCKFYTQSVAIADAPTPAPPATPAQPGK